MKPEITKKFFSIFFIFLLALSLHRAVYGEEDDEDDEYYAYGGEDNDADQEDATRENWDFSDDFNADNIVTTTGATAPKTNAISLSEVQQHSTADDCYIIVKNKVYNVTGIVSSHPDVFECGKDNKDKFISQHGENMTRLKPYFVAKLIPGAATPKSITSKNQSTSDADRKNTSLYTQKSGAETELAACMNNAADLEEEANALKSQLEHEALSKQELMEKEQYLEKQIEIMQQRIDELEAVVGKNETGDIIEPGTEDIVYSAAEEGYFQDEKSNTYLFKKMLLWLGFTE